MQKKQNKEKYLKGKKLLLEGCTYLDNAGTALYCQSQMNAIHEDMAKHVFTNPHTHFGEPVLGQVNKTIVILA